MSKKPYFPKRGEIILLTAGHGREAFLVLSEALFSEKTGLAVVCPVTGKPQGLAFEVALAGTKTGGAALPIHLRSVDIAAREAEFVEKTPEIVADTAAHYVKLILGGK